MSSFTVSTQESRSMVAPTVCPAEQHLLGQNCFRFFHILHCVDDVTYARRIFHHDILLLNYLQECSICLCGISLLHI